MGQSLPTCCCYNRQAQARIDITGFTPRVIPSVSRGSARGDAPQGKNFSPGQQRTLRTPLLHAAQEFDLDGKPFDEDSGQPATQLEHPSVGSCTHGELTCKKCCFFPKDRCSNGRECEFCHYEHEKRRRIKRKRKSKTTDIMDAAYAAQTGEPDNPLAEDEALGAPTMLPELLISVPRTEESNQRSELSDPASQGFGAVSADLHSPAREVLPVTMGSGYAEILGPQCNVGFRCVDHVHTDLSSPPLSTGMSCFHGVCYLSNNELARFGNTPGENGIWFDRTPAFEPGFQQSSWYHSPNGTLGESNGVHHDASARQWYGPYLPQETPTLPPGVEVAVDTEPVPMLPLVHAAFDHIPLATAPLTAYDKLATKALSTQKRFVGGRGGA